MARTEKHWYEQKLGIFSYQKSDNSFVFIDLFIAVYFIPHYYIPWCRILSFVVIIIFTPEEFFPSTKGMSVDIDYFKLSSVNYGCIMFGEAWLTNHFF